MTADAPDPAPITPSRPRRRGLRVLWWIVGALGALIVLAVVGIVIWSQVGVMAAEPEPLAEVRANTAIEITDTDAGIVLAPTGESADVGLVYIPGAKVDPWAYAYKLSGLVAEDGVTVVITKPWLNLAFFDLRPLSTFTDLAPDIDTWLVGGHSLGGVRACQLATDADGLALFGSYCATDLSDSGLPVISVSGSEDGPSTPEKIADARHLLPDDAEMHEIAGASHSSFGDYGPQPGDGTPTIADDDMRDQLTELVGPFALDVPGG
ncbi:alpha/beta hydrolase [Microbacterium kyungheense]|uniref:Alpha/beta hydrolase family protein n=1 Tax=Microbacterium kyungheense TaxID=1263636 RepID=A0A543FKX0_9MICO|nr:alpha/beta hydrolase [Microbacterium kyungheense]TQM34462.1 alpha/beta hydrolase family protein [Microbacterium kyungheense]